MASYGPYNNQRIRLLLQSPTSQPTDQFSSGGLPSFEVGTGIQVEVARSLNGVLIDASLFSSVTFAIKPASNEDAVPIVSSTATQSSPGWNSNATLTAGTNLVPGYAAYAAAGSAATGTAVIGGGGVASITLGSGGSGYSAANPPSVFLVGGGGTGAVFTATVAAGAVTGFVQVAAGSGYTSAPTVVLTPVASSYTLGVQQGATYTWTSGANDLSLNNGGTLVQGSNLVLAGSNYSGSGPYTYTLMGLVANSFYGYFLGADDTGVGGSGISSNAGTPFFLTGAGTTSATLSGTSVSAVTTEVYAATAGANIVPPANYPSTSLVSSGTNISTGHFVSIIGGTTTIYTGSPGSATLTGLTPGVTYYYSLGSNDTSFNGVAATTALSGLFTATGTTVQLAGISSQTITAKVFTTVLAPSTYVLTGLTNGQSYYFTLGANDTSCGTLVASGFFTATSSQVSIAGTSNALVTAQVQPLTVTASSINFIAASNTVTFTGYPGLAVTSQLTGNVGWQQSNDQLCVFQFPASQTNLATANGGSTNYWMLVTAVTVSGNFIVLGSGTLTAIDSGQATGTAASGNVVPSGASYSGGSYTLTGLTPGFAYYWVKGANDATAPGLTATGTFIPSSSSATLTGTGSDTITAAVYATNTRPYVGIQALTQGAVSLPISGLTFAPMGGRCDIMIPAGGTPIEAPLLYPSLSASGGTFEFDVPVPSAGYVALYTFY